MFKRMRIQLTAICALGTGTVLAVMAAVSLQFALTQLDRQSRENFENAVKTVLYHLQSQSVIDQGWLARTETDNSLWIRVESGSAGMQYTRQDERRQALTTQALAQAGEEYEFHPQSVSPRVLEAQTVYFEMNTADGGDYFACVAAAPRSGGILQVTVVRGREADRAVMFRLRCGFGLCVALGVVFLVTFAWFFSGHATIPVEKSHLQQTAFVSAASHELRAPLSVIRMSAGTIRRSPGHAEALAAKIEDESERMAELLGNLLFLARFDDGCTVLEKSPCSPKTMLLNTLEQFEPIATQKQVSLKLDIPGVDLPDVRCDQQLIQQILAILADNAIRFSPTGAAVTLSALRRGPHLLLQVADCGPGVPKDQRERIFERFYQADSAHSDREHYGLGLSIAAAIAKMHNAKLWVEANEPNGVLFILRLRYESSSPSM